MKLAVINDEISQDLDVAVASCLRHGFDGLEIRSVHGLPPHCLTDRHLGEIGVRVRASGLDVAAFASSAFKTPLPCGRRNRVAARDALCRSVDSCRRVGANALRIFSFLRDGDPEPATAAASISDVLQRVDLDDVNVVVETGTRTHTPTARHLRQLLDLVDHPALKALWDPANGVFAGIDSGPVPDGLELLAPGLLRHVHVKDPRGQSGYVPLGQGDIDWPKLLGALRRAGFGGWLSLETHWRHGRTLRGAQLDQPWGTAFSLGGREASDESMVALRRWVRGT